MYLCNPEFEKIEFKVNELNLKNKKFILCFFD
jgi:hypothetical protein